MDPLVTPANADKKNVKVLMHNQIIEKINSREKKIVCRNTKKKPLKVAYTNEKKGRDKGINPTLFIHGKNVEKRVRGRITNGRVTQRKQTWKDLRHKYLSKHITPYHLSSFVSYFQANGPRAISSNSKQSRAHIITPISIKSKSGHCRIKLVTISHG